ncbi:hypothetical protein [Luteipulveratus flavus]|uniref:Uncharacterized protein n=1 Tax=Luteipulveratus flavus TaxID=3031728 RepID=A0ABT6CAF3_9MICO|nr:hypothetical protein [Luteipulveratus sp. YIM 133296]MDF8265337.1 hypothetical protein [Luteipulveratus sp. YIM 133296]
MRTGRCIVVVGATALVGLMFWVAVAVGLYVDRGEAAGRPAPSGTISCTGRAGQECTNVPLPSIARASHLALPPATEVVDSSYQRFQDWRLTARLRLPAGASSPLAAPGVRSYYRSDGRAGPDGAYYRATQSRDSAGRLVLDLEIFTT